MDIHTPPNIVVDFIYHGGAYLAGSRSVLPDVGDNLEQGDFQVVIIHLGNNDLDRLRGLDEIR